MRAMAQTTPVLPYRSSKRRGRREPPLGPVPGAPRFMQAGRAWINGREVGGTDPRFAHLDRFYD